MQIRTSCSGREENGRGIRAPHMLRALRLPAMAGLAAATLLAVLLLASAPCPAWTEGGVRVSTSADEEYKPQVVRDGAGGAIVAWTLLVSGGTDSQVWVAKVNAAGTVSWRTRVADYGFAQMRPQLIPDGSGGAIVTWQMYPVFGGSYNNIYAARVSASGSVSWAVNASAHSFNETEPRIAPDGAGGAFIAWRDGRAGGANRDIYAQRYDGSGTRLWGDDGLRVDSAPSDDMHPQITRDGGGGAFITWQAFSGTINDIRLARLAAGGTVTYAQPFQAGPYDKLDPTIAWDGADGAVVTWVDLSDTDNWDVLAQNTFRTITASAGTGGSISPAGQVEVYFNSSQAYSITPDPGYHVTDVLVDGASVGAVTSYNFANVVSGHTIEASFAMYDFYFAEGYTGPGFQEYLCLGNPGDTEVAVEVTYLFTDGTSHLETCTVPAKSRFTADVNAEVGEGREVSIKCSAAFPYVAERPMYFDYTGSGASWTGGHDAVGATGTSKQWFFAEGYTGPGFDEWVCVLNPGAVDADLTFEFQTQEEGPKTITGGYTVPAHSRATFKANDLLGGGSYQASLMLTSDLPVVAERPMYFDYQGTGSWGWTGGHCVLGVPDPARQFYFAEGTTRAGFEEWLTIQNPGVSDISVNAVYQLGSGAPVTRIYDIPAGTRATVYVPDEVGTEQDVSVFLSSASYFLAERPMYFDYQGTAAWGWTGGHCVIGAAAPATDWFFAEGYTGDGFEEWLCIQNPGAGAASVTITYYPEGGAPIARPAFTVAANSRYTVNVNADAGAGLSLCAGVASDQPVIVERPMYFDYGGAWTGGHDVVGYTP